MVVVINGVSYWNIDEVSKLKQDISDMYNAHNTIFYRCSCGRIREKGLICPNEKCPKRCE